MAIGKDDITISVGAITKEFEQALRRIQTKGKTVGKQLEKQPKRFGAKALTTSMYGTVAALASVGYGVKQVLGDFQNFQKGLASVQKVADFSSTELKKFENNIDNLSKRIPVSTDELFKTAEAAAVLGVRGADNLTKFAETMGRLGVATDVHGEEAAKSISRIIQLSGESIETIDQFGSALVGLGNNFKASESEILSNATVIRQATAAYKISSAEILAMAAASREAGIASDLAGTSIGMTLREMDKAVIKGGKSLDGFQQVMGMTREEIKQLIKTSPAQAFQVFINGLSRMNKEGQDTILVMEDMGLGGRQLSKTLPSLAKINDRLNLSLDSSKQLYEENNALLKESNAFFDISASKMKVFTNRLKSLSKTVGEVLNPAFESTLEILGDITKTLAVGIEGIKSLSKALADAVMFLGGDGSSVINRMKWEQQQRQEAIQASKAGGETGTRTPSGTPAETGTETETGTGAEAGVGTSSDTGDGSGGGTDDKVSVEEEMFESYLERLRERQGREFTETKTFQDSLTAMLQDRLKSDSKIVREQAKQDLKNLKENQKKKEEITAAHWQSAFGHASNMLNNISQLSAKDAKKTFRLRQGAAMANAIMSTYAGATRAFADFPFPFNGIVAGLITAAGLANVAVISKQEPPKMRAGGIVQRQRGTPLTGDHQLARLEAGEFVTPRRNAEEEIDRRAREKGYQTNDFDMDDDQMASNKSEVMISLSDDASDFIFAEQRKNLSLGIGVT